MPERVSRPNDFQPVTSQGTAPLRHPDAPRAPAGSGADNAGATSEPTVVVDASAYLEKADAPFVVPEVATRSQGLATSRAASAKAPTAARKVSPVLATLKSVFGLSRVPTVDVRVPVPMEDGSAQELTVTFRPLGKEDQVWALDMTASYDYQTEAARNRMLNIACVAIAVAALEGKPLYEALGVEGVTSSMVRDPMNPPTIIRYRCATQMLFMLTGDGEDAMAPIFSELLLEHWLRVTEVSGDTYAPFYRELLRLQAERVERERRSMSQQTSNSEGGSQESSAQP